MLNQIHPSQRYYHFTLFMVINELSPWRPRLRSFVSTYGCLVFVSLSHYTNSAWGGGVICMWQVGIKCISGGAGDKSSEAGCSWKDVSHHTRVSDSCVMRHVLYAESRFSGLNVFIMYVSLCWAGPKYHPKITIHQINLPVVQNSTVRRGQHRVFACAERHDWACRADVLNRAGLVLQLRPSLSETPSE